LDLVAHTKGKKAVSHRLFASGERNACTGEGTDTVILHTISFMHTSVAAKSGLLSGLVNFKTHLWVHKALKVTHDGLQASI